MNNLAYANLAFYLSEIVLLELMIKTFALK